MSELSPSEAIELERLRIEADDRKLNIRRTRLRILEMEQEKKSLQGSIEKAEAAVRQHEEKIRVLELKEKES